MPPPRLTFAFVCVVLVAGVSGGVASAKHKLSGPRAVPVKLLAHDVSHAMRARPRSQTHPTPRRTDISALFRSPLTRLLPARSLSASLGALPPETIGAWDGTAAPPLGPGFFAPADPNGDIGMTQYVQATNFRLAVYSRAAPHALLGLVTSPQFWNGLTGSPNAALCASNPAGDPSVQYDRLADRWVFSEFAFAVDAGGNPVAPFVQCVAVSKTADATGEWYRYAFEISSTQQQLPNQKLFLDYPKLGIWPDGYYLSFNEFDLTTGSFVGAGALALERRAMLAGGAAQGRYFDLQGVTPGLGGMMPATLDTKTLPPDGAPALYLQSHDDAINVNDYLQVWAFHVDWQAPVTGSAFDPINDLPVIPFVSTFFCDPFTPDCIQQPGPKVPPTPNLDQVATVFQGDQSTVPPSPIVPQLMYHLDYMRDPGGIEHLVATQTVNVGGNRAGVRWYELTNATPATYHPAPFAGSWLVKAQGDYAPADGDSRFMSSGGIDSFGELAIAYSVSGANTSPSLGYAGRGALDGPGVMSAETLLGPKSTGSQLGSSRWGDYSSLSLDPLDLCTFWYTGEYASPAGWRTRIGEFSFPVCKSQSPTRPALMADQTWSTPIVREGQTITGTAAKFFDPTDPVTHQWRRCDRYGSSCVDIPGEITLTHTFSASDAAGDRTVRLQETAVNPSRPAPNESISVSTATPVVQSIPPKNLTPPSIPPTAHDGETLMTTNGEWETSSPILYTYRWRRCAPTVPCVNIPGATQSSYTVTTADVATKVDVVVSATNTGGGTDANAAATAPVDVVPVVTAGGTGGATGPPDLQVTGFASAATPVVGDLVTFSLTVTDANAILAQSLLLTVTLPSGLQFVSGTSDRGSGCSSSTATTVVCNLDLLSAAAPRANVQILARVLATGQQILTATVTAQQGLLNTTNATVSISVAVPVAKPTPGTPPVAPPVTPPVTKPVTPPLPTSTGIPTGLNGTPKTGPDKKKPTAHPFASKGTRGHTAKLRFRIYDDRGVAKAVAKVKRKGKVVGTAKTGFGPVASGSTYFVGWHVAHKSPTGRYAFCVVAIDRAGNRSRSTCAALTVK